MGFLRRFLGRLRQEAFTPRGRRRAARRIASRFLLVGLAISWTYPFVSDFWRAELVDFVSGRVVVTGRTDPLLRTSVDLVPDLPPDAGPEQVLPYARIDPGGLLPGVVRPEDAALRIWTDPDGRFAQMHVAAGRPYRVLVRRPGCSPVDFGVRTFRLLRFRSRRLHLEVPPCPGSR